MAPKDPKDILQSVFGYDSFRPLQEEIINTVLNKQDSLVIMPTGGGKSLCYQIPALIFDGLTIVVSPLISLMKDQALQLKNFGVEALVLNSSLDRHTYYNNMQKIRNNEANLLYIAPESLQKQEIQELLSETSVDLFAVDEAHCISEWGHDFRPEYRQLSAIRKNFPNTVTMALTATATPKVQDDIIINLELENAQRFTASFMRGNLILNVSPKNNPAAQVTDFLDKFPGQSGIIYCFTRKTVDDLTQFLQDEGYSAKPYHAGMDADQRKANQESFINDDTRIIVATVAFGMGINKPDVRFVLHYDLPKSIENYYQEVGRAGRDGLPAECLLLFNFADKIKKQRIIEQKESEDLQEIALLQLNRMWQFAEHEICRKKQILEYFGEAYEKENCGACDVCLTDEQELTDITMYAQKFFSCIKRTGGYFGAHHIIDILRGSNSQKILQRGHQHLSTYNIGADLSKSQWLSLTRRFITKNLLIKGEEFGELRLTAKGEDVLYGREKLLGHLPADTVKQKILRAEEIADYDTELFGRLRELRKNLAHKENIPPYMIFPDKTLMELAWYLPQSAESFRRMYGVGGRKAEKYAEPFLEVIQSYAAENNLAEKEKARRSRRTAGNSGRRKIGRKRQQMIGEMYNQGSSVREICAEFNVKAVTVITHLFNFYKEGNPLKSSMIIRESQLSETQQERAIAAFRELGTDFLKPVFELLNEEISYDELRIIRLYVLARQPEP